VNAIATLMERGGRNELVLIVRFAEDEHQSNNLYQLSKVLYNLALEKGQVYATSTIYTQMNVHKVWLMKMKQNFNKWGIISNS
jgi:hypothetical protein